MKILGAQPSYVPHAAAPGISGLGQALFGCAPENLPILTPDQRIHCANGFTRPDDSLGAEASSQVQDPVRRGAEFRTKNAPRRVSCINIMRATTLYGPIADPGMDPQFILDGLIDGFAPWDELQK